MDQQTSYTTAGFEQFLIDKVATQEAGFVGKEEFLNSSTIEICNLNVTEVFSYRPPIIKARCNLSFTGCIFSGFEFEPGASTGEFHFINCKFTETVYFSFSIQKHVQFENCIFEKDVWFKNSEIEMMEIDSCHFESTFDLTSGKIDQLTIKETNFGERVDFGFHFDFGVMRINADIRLCEFKKALRCNKATGKLTISTSNCYEGLALSPNLDQVNITECKKIKRLSLKTTSTSQNLIYVHLSNIETISFGSISKLSSLTVSHCKLSRLDFIDVLNNGDLTLVQSSEMEGTEKEIVIERSDLGKAKFIGCDFSEYELNFSESRINELVLIGSNLPITHRYNTPEAENERRIFLSQSRIVLKNSGYNIEANEAEAEELSSYYYALSWKDRAWEKLLLLLNRISSNHGQSWQRGLFSTLIAGAFCYTAYCYALGFHLGRNWTLFAKLAGLGLEFLNPLHKSDFIPVKMGIGEGQIPVSALVLENVSRIILAYFIYQLVQAFRKHGKK